jgi:hypothetical protein
VSNASSGKKWQALLTAFTADETVDPDETVDDLVERILRYMPVE